MTSTARETFTRRKTVAIDAAPCTNTAKSESRWLQRITSCDALQAWHSMARVAANCTLAHVGVMR